MTRRLFVGGMSFRTDENSLREAFSEFGTVTDVAVIRDRETGQHRGFGFVTFDDEQDAEHAASMLDGTDLDGRRLKVSEAEDKKNAARSPRPDQNRKPRRAEPSRRPADQVEVIVIRRPKQKGPSPK